MEAKKLKYNTEFCILCGEEFKFTFIESMIGKIPICDKCKDDFNKGPKIFKYEIKPIGEFE